MELLKTIKEEETQNVAENAHINDSLSKAKLD